MQLLLPAKQAERVDQPDEAEVVVPMKMGNKYMRDTAAAYLIIDHLDLCAFATVNQEAIAIQCNHLACRVSVECRYGGVISKDGNREHKQI